MNAIIIPARLTSSRLPNKHLKLINEKPVFQILVERLKPTNLDIILATTTNKEDDPLVELAESLDIKAFRGSENDLLDRTIQAAKKFKVDNIIDITGDCPVMDYTLINDLLNHHLTNGVDLTTNIETRSYPRGYDIRICTKEALLKIDKLAKTKKDREHVYTYAYLNKTGKKKFNVKNYPAVAHRNRPDIEVTLDTKEDLELLRFIFNFEKQGYNLDLNIDNVINLLDTYKYHPIVEASRNVKRKKY